MVYRYCWYAVKEPVAQKNHRRKYESIASWKCMNTHRAPSLATNSLHSYHFRCMHGEKEREIEKEYEEENEKGK